MKDTTREMLVLVIKYSAIGNSLTQLAMIFITFYSLMKINRFISFYPGLEINVRTTLVHCVLLVLLALTNISLISTIYMFVHQKKKIFDNSIVYYLSLF